MPKQYKSKVKKIMNTKASKPKPKLPVRGQRTSTNRKKTNGKKKK